jgi:hypothetical protein
MEKQRLGLESEYYRSDLSAMFYFDHRARDFKEVGAVGRTSEDGEAIEPLTFCGKPTSWMRSGSRVEQRINNPLRALLPRIDGKGHKRRQASEFG